MGGEGEVLEFSEMGGLPKIGRGGKGQGVVAEIGGISVSRQFNSSIAFILIFATILSKFPDAFLRATIFSFSKAL